MSTELDLLERDVVAARRRVQDDLANLRGPAAASLKRDLTERADGVLTEIKDRLTANPVATVAIGAGVAWKLVHRPPIASLLVGYGLYSLIRTDPRRPSAMSGLARQAIAAGEAAAGRASEFAGEARSAAAEGLRSVQETVRKAADTVADGASAWTTRASEAATEGMRGAQEAAGQASDTLGRAADAWRARAGETAAAAAAQARERAHDFAAAAQRDKDTYLLGFAAAALAAAIGIAAQRRAQ
ncbi:MAG TPA: hypothetical protein VKX28_27340 [Xanthobacteraceae bacterium]|nr:hypothetical protein [Xanthobacteraceae bacterium]